MKLHAAGEFGLIARLQERLAHRAGVLHGIGDDAAVLCALDSPVVTCDALLEGVHFRRDWTSPRLLGRKAISVNVSDIAAMGGRPVAAFVMLAVASSDTMEEVEEFYAGMEEAAALYELTIAGGDTVRAASGWMLGITVVGDAPQPVLRSGATPDDVLLVTGTLGDAAAGLALLNDSHLNVSEESRTYLLDRHHNPLARVREMQAALAVRTDLAAPVVTAALDLSDGLAGDAVHIASCSNVTLEIEAARLPISDACREAATVAGVEAVEWALRGGEDYELLLCVPEMRAEAVLAAIAATGTPAAMIGRCLPREAEAVVVKDQGGRHRSAPPSWTHF